MKYRDAVSTSSPTLPGFGGYVGSGDTKADATPSGLRRIEIHITQGSRGGNPGLEVATASRYLITASWVYRTRCNSKGTRRGKY